MHQLIPFIPGYLDDALKSIGYFMPEIWLSALFIVVLVTDLIFGRNSSLLCKIIACFGLCIVMIKDLEQIGILLNHGLLNGRLLFSQMLLLNKAVIWFKFFIDALAFILLLYFSWDNHLKQHRKGLSDFYSIVTASLLGLHLMVMAVNMLSIYLAIEMVSIASYLLVAYRSESGFSTEAGLKYVLFGAVSSAVMLYGISLLYALSGSFELYNGQVPFGLMQADHTAVAFALLLVFAGIGFKLSFVPVHFWVPDVYQGATTPVTAYLSTLPKIAGFALLLNFVLPFALITNWHAFNFRLFLAVVGIITMIAGNFAAVLQTNVKRLLAYSSIAHTGFALMGVAAFATPDVTVRPAIIFYLFVYGLASIGALALASYFTNLTGAESVNDYKGLGFKYPVASISFVIILISLTGIPITAGFTGKLLIFSSVYGVYQNGHNLWLLILIITGALATVISLFYYLRIPLNLFLRRSDIVTEADNRSLNLMILSAIIALGLVLLGIFPGVIMQYL
jgi:NADH-quinone oxidoreductase subunit N